MFYRFIWNGGRDRVKRAYVCNHYEYCGLKMIDPYNFFLAQKMVWVKLLLDNQFESIWKTIELTGMDQQYGDMLWRSYAPECVLNKLHSTLLADSLRTWYIYREKACKEIRNTSFCDMGNMQCLWCNRNIRSRTKQLLFYEDWYEKGIQFISDLLIPPLPGSKLFEELVLDFDVSKHDKRKFNFLMKCIPSSWPQDSNSRNVDLFDTITLGLLSAAKVPKFAYSFFNEPCIPENRMDFWEKLGNADDEVEDTDWNEIHIRNFKCSIDTRLRSFYFKIFHKAIAFNNFLFKINRKNSPNCDSCDKFPESVIHIFFECDFVRPIWEELFKIIKDKYGIDFSASNFDKIFGVFGDKFLTYLILCLKYHIYSCKFQNKRPTFSGFKIFVKNNSECEYIIAKKRDKLSFHFEKWRFEL